MNIHDENCDQDNTRRSKDNRPVIPVLVVALITLDILIHGGEELSRGIFTLPLAVGLIIGQAIGLAGWLVFGRRSFVQRLAIGAVAILGLSSTLATCASPDRQECLSFVVAVVVLMAAVFTLQLSNVSVVDVRTGNSLPETARTKRRQISLRELFRFVTVVAIVLGVVQWLGRFPFFSAQVAFVYLSTFSTVGGMALWSAIARDSRLWRLTIVIFIAPCLGAATAIWPKSDSWPLTSAISTFIAMTCVVLGLIVRIAGYRLVPRKFVSGASCVQQSCAPGA